mmetsp:Transcript_34263/g.82522  ORF Transcript_34263/g.82522 Transcript_34263/m.82522 type:complete len:713 (-) Transcript_34263:171-2309(-)
MMKSQHADATTATFGGGRMTRLVGISYLVVAVVVVLATMMSTQVVTAQSSNNVVIGNDERLTRFSSLLDRTGAKVNDAKTLFLPTGDGLNKFQKDYPEYFQKYNSQPEFLPHLRRLIQNHLVSEGAYTYEQIFDGSRNGMKNVLGDNITIEQRTQTIGGTPGTAIVERNIETAQGYIHIMDQLIIPQFMGYNLIQMLLETSFEQFAYSTMANIALYVELDDRLNDVYENGLTLLVPPNIRFNRAEIDVPALLTPESFNFTRDFILTHMVKRNEHENGVFGYHEQIGEDQHLVLSELGTHMWITTTGKKLRFQSIDVLVPDQPTNNGLFHVIDYPLFPPYITDFAFFTPLSTDVDTSDCFRFFRQCLLNSDDIAAMYNTTLTMMCPTREAFGLFNNEDFNRLLEPIWYRHACEFLFNHIATPAMTRAELVAKAPTDITMLNGATYDLRKSGDLPRLKNGLEEGKSEFGDLIALDGYLHTIDTAITPTAVSRSVYDQSVSNPDFSLLVENIDFVDLTDLVDRDLPLTLLAPNNAAFRRVEFGTLEGGEIIKRHLFRGLFFCDVLANMTTITAVNDYTHEIELRGEESEEVWVGGAKIYECDILARNGVLHYIDRVIDLDYDTVPPTMSPAPTITPVPTAYEPPTSTPEIVDTNGRVPSQGATPIYLPPVRAPTIPPLNPADAQSDISAAADRVSLYSRFVAMVIAVGAFALMEF